MNAYETHECGWGVQCSRFSPVVVVVVVVDVGGLITGFSSLTGVGGASCLGGILSLIASSPFASANDVILWFGEKPWRATKKKKVFFHLFFISWIIKIRGYYYQIFYHFLVMFYHPTMLQVVKHPLAWDLWAAKHSHFLPCWRIKKIK